MSLRRVILFAFLMLCAMTARAQEASKQAKDLYDKGRAESDSQQRLSDFCQAHRLDPDPKIAPDAKKYAAECAKELYKKGTEPTETNAQQRLTDFCDAAKIDPDKDKYLSACADALSKKGAAESDRPQLQLQDFCSAAQSAPKNKKQTYQPACDEAKTKLHTADAAHLKSAQDAFKAGDLDKAQKEAELAESPEDTLNSEAEKVKNQVHEAKNDRLYNQIAADWRDGNADRLKSEFESIADPKLKDRVKNFKHDFDKYNSYLEEGKARENTPLDKDHNTLTLARTAYDNARKWWASEPNHLTEKIADLDRRISDLSAQGTPSKPVDPRPTPAATTPTPQEVLAKIKEAQAAEKAGDREGALKDYQLVLASQPANRDAKAAIDRLTPIVQAAQDRKALKKAIGDFYAFRLADAQRELNAYLRASPAPLTPGPAYFYLGAALLEQSILNTPQAKWAGPTAEAAAAFREAKKAGYAPVRKYVAGGVLRVWDGVGQ